MPAFFALQLSSGCTNGAGFITLADAGSPAADFDYTIIGAASGPVGGGTISAADLPLTFEGLANDSYTVSVRPNGEPEASRRVSISCSAVLKLRLANVVATPVTVAGGTGSLVFDVTGNGSRAFDVYLYRSASGGVPGSLVFSQLNATTPVGFQIPNLPAGTYSMQVYAVDPSLPVSDVDQVRVTIGPFVPAPRGGCTDRSATNYDPAATFDDGSCAYLPPAVPTPVFAVPLLNPLRFVQAEIPDGCQTFETLDNTLFCQQQRPGQQQRPLFYQPVAYCDPVRVQVLTNYPSVEAIVHQLPGGQTVGPPQPLRKVLALQGEAPLLQVELSAALDGNTYVISATGGLAPSLLAATRVALVLDTGGPALAYRVLSSGRASATVDEDFLIINRPYVATPTGTYPAVSWQLAGPGFNVWEQTLELSALPPGGYEIRLHGYDAANHSAEATSEPLRLADAHENTVVLDYGNTDNAFGTVWSTGYRARLRVPGTFFRQKNAGTSQVHRNSDDSVVVLASTAQRRTLLETYWLPDWLHEKLFLATRLDSLRVNGQPGTAPEAYDWSPNRAYPLSSGRVAIEPAGWLGAGNGDDTGANDTGEGLLVLRRGGFLQLRG